jgi:hypothetical protein
MAPALVMSSWVFDDGKGLPFRLTVLAHLGNRSHFLVLRIVQLSLLVL